MDLNKEQLRNIFNYKDGHLIWKSGKLKGTKVGYKTKTTNKRYSCILFKHQYKAYYAHRIIWIYHYGEIDFTDKIVHIDGNRCNNNINNLRKETSEAVGKKRTTPKNNTSGYKGVSYDTRHHVWRSYINIERKLTFLGTFHNMCDAVVARKNAEKTYGYAQ